MRAAANMMSCSGSGECVHHIDFAFVNILSHQIVTMILKQINIIDLITIIALLVFFAQIHFISGASHKIDNAIAVGSYFTYRSYVNTSAKRQSTAHFSFFSQALFPLTSLASHLLIEYGC